MPCLALLGQAEAGADAVVGAVTIVAQAAVRGDVAAQPFGHAQLVRIIFLPFVSFVVVAGLKLKPARLIYALTDPV